MKYLTKVKSGVNVNMEDSIKKELFIKTVREWQSIKADAGKRIWELTQKPKALL